MFHKLDKIRKPCKIEGCHRFGMSGGKKGYRRICYWHNKHFKKMKKAALGGYIS